MSQTYIIGPGQSWPVEARLSEPVEPGLESGGWAAPSYAWYTLGFGEEWREGSFSANKALTYSVLWGCVSYISQTIASLDWLQYERQDEGREQVPLADPVSWLLGMQASNEMNAYEFRQVLLKDALLWGNGYAEIERNGMGRPWNLWRLDPGRISLERDDRGALYYEVRNPDGDQGFVTLDPANIFHLRGLSPDGLLGYSVVQMARESIELGLQEERFGTNFFRRGPMPGGILEVPGIVKKAERDEMRASFEKSYGGSANAGRVVVLSGGAKFRAVTMPNDDAQWIEGRTFQADEIARWFRVPPHKVGLLSRSTFSNIEQQAIEAVQDCLLPWCRRLEMEADTKLFGRNTMGRRFTRLNLDTLLRGDSATQTATVVQRVNNGLLTVNEGRDYFDLNPIEGGDTPLIQGAMVPLERVLEEPPEPPMPEPSPEVTGSSPVEPAAGKPAATMPAVLRHTFGKLLTEVYSRLLRIEADKAGRARNQGRLANWGRIYYDVRSEVHVAQNVLPVIEALALFCGRPVDARALAANLARQHALAGRADPPAADFALRAARQAEVHLEDLWQALRLPANGEPIHAEPR